MACKINFTNLNTYEGAGHVVTNEAPRIHNKLLRLARVKSFSKAASICSGGEIPYFVLLPRTTDLLICVDHSTTAITSAISKAILLAEVGVKETKRLLATYKTEYPSQSEILSRLVEMIEMFPLALRERITFEASLKISNDRYRRNPIWMHLFDVSIPRIWSLASTRALEISREKIKAGIIHFVHGDLRDISSMGPFDVLYTSNMRQHTPRDRQQITQADPSIAFNLKMFHLIEPLVKRDGLLLETGDKAPLHASWKHLKSLNETENMTWNYFSYRKVNHETVQAIAPDDLLQAAM